MYLPWCVLRDAVAQAMLPVKEGCMALEQTHRRRHAAYVAAWADCARFAHEWPRVFPCLAQALGRVEVASEPCLSALRSA